MYDSFNLSACACILNLKDWGVKLFAYAWTLFLGCYVAACVEEWGIQKNSQHIGRNAWRARPAEFYAFYSQSHAQRAHPALATASYHPSPRNPHKTRGKPRDPSRAKSPNPRPYWRVQTKKNQPKSELHPKSWTSNQPLGCFSW